MKLFIIKLLTAIAVILTMYASVVIVHDDARNNSIRRYYWWVKLSKQ